MDNLLSNIVFLSFIGSMLPAIFWLEFWLHQSIHREPRHYILGAFILGMAGVLVAGPLEHFVDIYVQQFTFVSFIFWALIEESVKFSGAYFSGLRTRFCDDVIDPIIYMITSALGFAAAENIIYLHDAFLKAHKHGFETITSRFIGPTILHIICSGIIGIAIGMAFFRSKITKAFALISGISIAVVLHAIFNSLIIAADNDLLTDTEKGTRKLWIFSVVWILLVVVIIVLEKLKSTKRIT